MKHLCPFADIYPQMPLKPDPRCFTHMSLEKGPRCPALSSRFALFGQVTYRLLLVL